MPVGEELSGLQLGRHHITCSAHRDSKIGSPGCVCVVTNKNMLRDSDDLFNRAIKERDEARAFGEKAAEENARLIKEAMTVTCAFCGEEYPRGTPRHGDGALVEHIRVCSKHPMRELEQELVILKSGALMARLVRLTKDLADFRIGIGNNSCCPWCKADLKDDEKSSSDYGIGTHHEHCPVVLARDTQWETPGAKEEFELQTALKAMMDTFLVYTAAVKEREAIPGRACVPGHHPQKDEVDMLDTTIKYSRADTIRAENIIYRIALARKEREDALA